MKLILKEIPEKELTVTIEYPKKDEKVRRLIHKVKDLEYALMGTDNGRDFRILVEDIYYLESVDKKVFIYTKDSVYRSEKRLYQLEAELKSFKFVKVNKCCLLNIMVLNNLKTLMNSRLEAQLDNGEKIVVSRTYIEAIKNAI